jgi:thiamine biosynthesis lipoprotein
VIDVSIAEMIVPDLHRRGARVPVRGLHTDHDGESAGWTSTWRVWGTVASVTVTEPSALPAARRLVSRQFAAAEKAAARFRKDAELHRLYRAGGRAITVSPLLAELVGAALAAAERTDGDVDPTVAAAMTAVHGPGHRDRDASSLPVCGTRTATRPVTGWQRVDLRGRRLLVPAGTTLDLSATATSFACDRAAATVRARLNVGVLVTMGGDAASAGPGPDGGWRVMIEDQADDRRVDVLLPAGAALATSHFTTRRDRDDSRVGHLIDPRTGHAPAAVWRTASAIGFTSLEASTYTAAALIRGTSARAWLGQLWVPARLVTAAGDVITVGPWSAHEVRPTSGPTSESPTAGPTTTSPTSSNPTDSADGPVLFPSPRLANPRRTTR